MMLIYAFYVIHSHQVKKRVDRNLFTLTPLYPLVNALYNLIFYGQFKKSIKMFNSLIVFTGRKCPFLGYGRAFFRRLSAKDVM